MQTMMNGSIEPPEREFVIEFVAFGNLTRAAVSRRIKILAKTRKGATRIVRTRYVRSGDYKVISETACLLSGKADLI